MVDRQQFAIIAGISLIVGIGGCAHRQYAHIMRADQADLVGSHTAGAATWNPLVDESVSKLLSRALPNSVVPAGFEPQSEACGPGTICFVGVENKSAEELVDFKDQIYERIDAGISGATHFRTVSRRMVDAALHETRLRPDALFLPANRDLFASVLGKQGTPVDYLLFATITSGTTERNSSYQRDYLLTLEMVNIHSGEFFKESAMIRKGYHHTRVGKWWNFGLGQGDG
jgi:hypothetical protein